jgi:hypothetical protein
VRITCVYLSGPMAGRPRLNVEAFDAAAAYLRRKSPPERVVLLPHGIEPWAHEGECPGGYRAHATAPHAAACYLRTDIIMLLTRADEVVMLPGWELSVGARLEMQVAATCGIPISFFDKEILEGLLRGNGPDPQEWEHYGCGHPLWTGGPHCTDVNCLNYAGRYHGK